MRGYAEVLPELSQADQQKAARLLAALFADGVFTMPPPPVNGKAQAEQCRLVCDYLAGVVIPALENRIEILSRPRPQATGNDQSAFAKIAKIEAGQDGYSLWVAEQQQAVQRDRELAAANRLARQRQLDAQAETLRLTGVTVR